MPRQQNKSSEPLPREQSEQGEPLSSISSIMPLEETGNTDFFYGSLFKDEIAIELDSDNEQASVEVANVEVIICYFLLAGVNNYHHYGSVGI